LTSLGKTKGKTAKIKAGHTGRACRNRTLLALMTIWTIARHSFREAIRKRVLVVAGIFALALMGSAPFWPVMTDADRAKLVKDISLTAMTFLGVIVAVFISAYSLPSDIEEKRIFTVASKPVSRHQILLGKLCGFLMVFATILAVMGILSDAVVRSVSTFSRVEVAAAEAPMFVNGVVIGAVGKGADLRTTREKGDYYEVVLPDDLAVKEAAIASSDVEADKTSGQVRVVSPEAALTYNGVEVARVSKDTELAIKNTLDGSYIVHLPEDLRITRVLLPASHVSPPRRTPIRSKRIVQPVDVVYSNEGTIRYETDALVLDTSFSKIGEVWRFRGIEPDKLPLGPHVRLMLRVPGIYGVAVERDAAGRFDQATIREFDAELRITNLKTGRVVKTLKAQAIWGDRFFTMSFDLPRQALDGGDIEVAMTGTNPEFLDLSTDFFSGRRSAAWRFRGLKMRRFGAEGEIKGEMRFELRQGELPADGGRVAQVQFKIAPPSGKLSEIVTVPIRNRKQVEFAFGRELIDAHGNVDVSIHNVPESFQLGIPAKDVTVKLLEKPVSFELGYLKAVALIFCQLMLVSSVTVAASTFLSGGVAALVGFFTYFCGLAVSSMSQILEIGPQALAGHHHGPAATAEAAHKSWTVIEPMLRIFVTIVPDVSKLDAKTYILQGLDVPVSNVLAGAGRVLLYAIASVIVAHVVFRHKELG